MLLNILPCVPCSKPALQVLLSFHNAMYGKNETPDTLPPDELALAARKAAQTLLTKTKVLRRQRLSIIFDKYCWVVPQGALMHMTCCITNCVACHAHDLLHHQLRDMTCTQPAASIGVLVVMHCPCWCQSMAH